MRLVSLALGAFLVGLHFLLHVGFGIGGAAPDLLTVGLLIAARELRVGTAAGLGFVLGVLEDSLSVLAFGAHTVALSVVGIAGASTRELFVGDSWLFVVSYFFVGKWLRDALHWVLVGEELRRPFVEQLLVQGLSGAAYATLVGVALLVVTGFSSDR